jgi:tellurite resistance protein TerC
MLAVLVAVATTDVAFAADSVPAIFAVTDEPFLVFAANAFSVLGMLALYFLLAGMLGRFRFLRPALAAILVFVGLKMSASDFFHVPAAASLAVLLAILAVAVAASIVTERRRSAPSPAPTTVPVAALRRPLPRQGGKGDARPLRHRGVRSASRLRDPARRPRARQAS